MITSLLRSPPLPSSCGARLTSACCCKCGVWSLEAVDSCSHKSSFVTLLLCKRVLATAAPSTNTTESTPRQPSLPRPIRRPRVLLVLVLRILQRAAHPHQHQQQPAAVLPRTKINSANTSLFKSSIVFIIQEEWINFFGSSAIILKLKTGLRHLINLDLINEELRKKLWTNTRRGIQGVLIGSGRKGKGDSSVQHLLIIHRSPLSWNGTL